MISLHVSLSGGLAFMMLTHVLSRSLYQVLAEVSRRSCPTSGLVFRAFTTSSPNCGEANDSASVVTYLQLKTMLSNHDIQLYDVRNPDEYQAGRIPDAVNIPLDNLEESLKLSLEHFQQKFEVRAPKKDDDNIVFHCRSGKRSSKALDIARQLGFSRINHSKGKGQDIIKEATVSGLSWKENESWRLNAHLYWEKPTTKTNLHDLNER